MECPPSITLPEATERERAVAVQYTRITPAHDEDWADAHQAWLRVGPQAFRLGPTMETRAEAEWLCLQVARALMVAIDAGP